MILRCQKLKSKFISIKTYVYFLLPLVPTFIYCVYFLFSVLLMVHVTNLWSNVGVGLAIGSLIYLVSAIKGEEWRSPVSDGKQTTQKASHAKYISDAPKNPPPRRPVGAAVEESQ